MNAKKTKTSKKCPLCEKKTVLIVTEKLRKGEPRKVFYCRPCGLGFLDSGESEAEVKAYYKSRYRKEYKPDIAEKTNPKKLFDTYAGFQRDRLDLIAPYLKKNTRLLEVGCSAGMFLWHARKKVKEAVGIDFDTQSARYAARKCGCRVYTEEISRLPFPKGYFNVICAFQTLEHVKDPLGFLNELREYLKPGGILYVEVPNFDDVLVSSYDLPFHSQFYFHPAHLFYFTHKSLKKTLLKAGFSGDVRFTQDYNLVNHFNWLINDAPQKNCLSGLSAPELRFKPGVSAAIKARLGSFLLAADKKYKKLLADLGLTSNLAFIGRKNGSGRAVN